MNKIILILISLLFPVQVLACNYGCGHNGCGNTNPSQPSANTQNIGSCTGSSAHTSKTTEQRLCTNTIPNNGNKYNCGGNKK